MVPTMYYAQYMGKYGRNKTKFPSSGSLYLYGDTHNKYLSIYSLCNDKNYEVRLQNKGGG